MSGTICRPASEQGERQGAAPRSAAAALILGAGLMQRPAILAAKRLGFFTVVTDADPAAPCVSLADRFEPVDLKDRVKILSLARSLQGDGGLAAVFTAGTDFSASVSYAGERLGLRCHSFEAALNASDKTRMRARFAAAGVPSPLYFSLRAEEATPEKARDLCGRLGFPCVAKPADNMGARGCRMVRTPSEAFPAVRNAAAASRTSTAVLEQYMDGPEYSIDALIFDGTMTVTGFADRHIQYPPYFIETGHTMPSEIDGKKRAELISAFALGAAALGLTCGAAKADIKYTADGPMIGEIAARLSGGYMSGWTYPYASGCNLTEQALLIACGQEPKYLVKNRRPVEPAPLSSCPGARPPFALFELPCPRFSAERAWISVPGTVRRVEGLDAAAGTPLVQDVLPRPGKADGAVDFPRNNVEKCGNVITLSSDRTSAVAAAEDAVSRILVRLESRQEKTEAFLSGASAAGEDSFPPPAYGCFSDALALDLSGRISENASVLEDAGPALRALLDLPERDWSYRTARRTAELFDEICPRHPPLDRRRFWLALFRGGLQAAVYVSDSAADSGAAESGVPCAGDDASPAVSGAETRRC